MITHKLTAVGLGPGDPELITIKGLRAIKAAELIFVPQSKEGDRSLALRIVEGYIDTGRQQVVPLALPMTRNSDELAPAWRSAADEIARYFTDTNHTSGVYLLLGDPLLYGTFIYIWSELQARYRDIEIEIVPGITSFAAAAALTQTPLGTTSDRVAILPASYEVNPTQLQRLLADFDTVILMKVGLVLPAIIRTLEELDLLSTSVYVERVGMPEERVVTDLGTLRAATGPYLSLILVRK